VTEFTTKAGFLFGAQSASSALTQERAFDPAPVATERD
jgi:hypothetical protein